MKHSVMYFIQILHSCLRCRMSVLLLVILSLNLSETSSQSSVRIKFCHKRVNPGSRLNVTVLSHRHALSDMDCVLQCVYYECCRSLNYRQQVYDGKENCELLHSLASEEPENLQKNELYEYIALHQPHRFFDCYCDPQCRNNGTCQPGSLNCSCGLGFTGRRCETDIDECVSNPCDQNAQCRNTIGSYVCTCLHGFSGNGTHCEDVDECISNPCDRNAACDNTVASHTCTCNDGFSGNGTVCTVKSCSDLKSTSTKNGIYLIDPDDQGSFPVYCDMTTGDGGWTVFQRRKDGSENFYRNWTEYKNGFGNLSGEFWLGLDKINRITTNNATLRIDLRNKAKEYKHAKYPFFRVASEAEEYKLTVADKCAGRAYDSLRCSNGMLFTTRDKDNDGNATTNCAEAEKGAWWYPNECSEAANLNGHYTEKGVKWSWWKTFTEMKVRPSGASTADDCTKS